MDSKQFLEVLKGALSEIEETGQAEGVFYGDDDKIDEKLRKAIEWFEARSSAVDSAIALAVRYGSIDGDHHKNWVIDQMVRHLAGDRYAGIVAAAKSGEDGPDSYVWDTGTPP